MKAISIKQPWGSLIVSGVKDIENRTWATKFRGRVLVHAGAKSANYWDSPLCGIIDEFIRKITKTGTDYSNYQHGAIIGSVEIVDCVINHPSIWAEHEVTVYSKKQGKEIIVPVWNWVLANPVLFAEPILNVKGKLSFWDYPMTEDEYLNRLRIGNPLKL